MDYIVRKILDKALGQQIPVDGNVNGIPYGLRKLRDHLYAGKAVLLNADIKSNNGWG